MSPQAPDNPQHFECHIKVSQDGMNAPDLLAEECTLSRTQIKQAMQNGALWIERGAPEHELPEHGGHIQRLRRAKKVIPPGDTLHLYYDKAIQQQTTRPAELVVDEGGYSIWNKPCGMYSQGSRWGDHCTIYRYAEKHLKPERPAFIVHRLDRAASGLMILAHSKKMAAKLSSMFRERNIHKQYEAIVEADLTELALPYEINNAIDGKSALSRITAVEKAENGSRLCIEIESGRKHQIRRHLAENGWPIIGDRLYGKADTEKDLQLKSVYLKFTCPTTDQTKEYKLQ